MRKHLALLLLLVSSSVYTMENSKLLTVVNSVKSGIVSKLSKKLSLMEALEIDKNKFEKAIQLPRPTVREKTYAYLDGRTVGYEQFSAKFYYKFFTEENLQSQSPHDFLTYCYHREYRGDGTHDLKHLVECSDFFDKCKNIRIDGYSALGAAFLAQNVDAEKRYKFLELLLAYGFEWTEKDRDLIALKFYNMIPLENKRIITFLLCDHQEGNFCMLPHEVRKYIVSCMIGALKSYHKLQTFLFRLKVL